MVERGRILAVGGAVVLALILVWGAGCSSSEQEPPPFTVSESEVRAECLTATFVPEEPGKELVEEPPPRNWKIVENAPKAMPAERAAIEVTLRPREGAPTITITDVHFDVVKLPLRPIGSIFYRPCKRRLAGAAVEAAFDGFVRIVSSNSDPGKALGVGFRLPPSGKPIRFPWKISLAEPLHLFLIGDSEDTYADWAARIKWTSGSDQGVIHVDHGGKKYKLVDGKGTSWYKPGPGGQWVGSETLR